jgi:hypothetical protein
MTISFDRLSLWEIAHRWHNADPFHSKTIADIPLDVKDTLRNLAAEVYYERLYSSLLLKYEANTHKPVFKRNWPFFWKKTWLHLPVSHYEKEFKAAINNKFDPSFLQSVMISFWELEYWCNEFQIPFPDFWIRSIDRNGTKAPFPGAIVFIQEEDESDSEDHKFSGEKFKSEKHSQAAHKSHDKKNQLKRRCVQFSLTEKGSNNQIALRFYDSLSEQEKTLSSAQNAASFYSKAISDYKKGINHYWLEGIPPYQKMQT